MILVLFFSRFIYFFCVCFCFLSRRNGIVIGMLMAVLVVSSFKGREKHKKERPKLNVLKFRIFLILKKK